MPEQMFGRTEWNLEPDGSYLAVGSNSVERGVGKNKEKEPRRRGERGPVDGRRKDKLKERRKQESKAGRKVRD